VLDFAVPIAEGLRAERRAWSVAVAATMVLPGACVMSQSSCPMMWNLCPVLLCMFKGGRPVFRGQLRSRASNWSFVRSVSSIGSRAIRRRDRLIHHCKGPIRACGLGGPGLQPGAILAGSAFVHEVPVSIDDVRLADFFVNDWLSPMFS